MTEENQPWTARFRPKTLVELVGNERAVRQLETWVRSWEKGVPKQRAVFLYGPPGVGKTVSVLALANKLGYDVMEVNSSDYRTRKNLDSLIGRSIHQRFTITGRRRMILFDELEGVSGREDYGGIGAIAGIIKATEIPVVLIATSIRERWEDKFRPLRDISLHIKYNPVPFSQILMRLKVIVEELGISVDEEVLELLADLSEGDLRSTINDLEAVARGKTRVTMEDTQNLAQRDRKDYTPDALAKMFSAKTLRDARRVVSSAHISYDDLYNWIYENLPIVLDNPLDLVEGMNALARADIHQTRARRTQSYRLLKYMFNEMTGGVALARRNSEGLGLVKMARQKIAEQGFPPRDFTITETPDGVMIKPNRYLKNDWRRVNEAVRSMGAVWVRRGGCWNLPYFRSPQQVWRYRRTWQSRRRRRSLAARVAEKCHVSSHEAVAEVIPLLKVIFEEDPFMAGDIAGWLGLEDGEVKWLKT
ncbi:MAG: replication factor C large subunit [Candidatus Bathyarchaeota archaeon]|nr:MAG: replication factor C large subunit [Candidatus Bathyarchaeota archaeon]